MATSRHAAPLFLGLLLLALVGGALLVVLADDPPAAPGPAAAVETVPSGPVTGQRIERRRAETQRARVVPEPPTETPDEHADEPPDQRPAEEPSADSERTIRVLVVQEGGIPVRDAHVRVFSIFGRVAIRPGDARTDAEGRVTLHVTGGSSLRVRAWTRDAATAGERAVADPGETLDVTLTLRPGRLVAGRVVSAGGDPVANARVVLRLPTEDPFGLSFETRTGANGGFDLGGAEESLVLDPVARLVVEADGFVSLETVPRESAQDLQDLLLTIERGRVAIGRCVAVGAAPVSGVLVGVRGVEYVHTGRDGRFEIHGIAPEGASLELDPPEHVVPALVPIPAGRRDVDLGDILLVTGLPVSGVVIDAQGRPVESALVSASETKSRRNVRRAVSDAGGAFTLEHLGPGGHTLVASATTGGEWSSRLSGTVEDVHAGTAGLRIVLSGGLSLLVEFRRESDRTPVEVASAEVQVTRTDVASPQTGSAWAGPGMTSVRVPFEEPGRYMVVVKVPGYQPATLEDVEVLDDRPVRIEALFREEPQ